MRGIPEGSERRVAAGKLRLTVAFAVLVALIGVALAASSSAAGPSGLQRAIAVQEQNTDRLLSRGVIVGTGVGRDSSGSPEIVVLAKRKARVARSLGGFPVKLKVTGPISSLRLVAPRKKPENPGGGHHGGGGEEEPSLSPTDRLDRPVPIGVSTGNVGECSAGTIGARVKDAAGNFYALSNNHVYALENKAPIGSSVLQPGRYDTGCATNAGDVIGALDDFEEISFTKDNKIDAAIASLNNDGSGKPLVGNSTPPGSYGTPSSKTAVGLGPVQKYGRTTEETHGYAYAINGIVTVGYSQGTARFVEQVFVEGRKGPFIKAGDSGSLLVTDDASANPVGLLFAGDNSGKFAVANQIDAVLTRFGVTVDGE